MLVSAGDNLCPDAMERLLGRAPNRLDMQPARRFFETRTVLVTGAGGSIGSALCRQLLAIGAAKVVALDSSDHGLIDLIDSVRGTSHAGRLREVICDVRDAQRLDACIRRARPDVVIHAAALKHVHMGERHPSECVLTNLIGARNALDAAIAAKAERFVLVSSDKAAAAGSVMGACKRLAELYVADRGREAALLGRATRPVAVRFGNVFGSKGSVVPVFKRQIDAGGPLTITHQDMRRFFMSLPEAVQLILAVPALMHERDAGSTFLLDMGEPVRILDLAHRMIAESGKSIKIDITGVREGEKLDEQLFDEHELVEPSDIAGVSRLTPAHATAELPAGAIDEIERTLRALGDDVLRHRVFALLDAHLGTGVAAVG